MDVGDSKHLGDEFLAGPTVYPALNYTQRSPHSTFDNYFLYFSCSTMYDIEQKYDNPSLMKSIFLNMTISALGSQCRGPRHSDHNDEASAHLTGSAPPVT
jgi:hypothetical protein